MKKIIAIFMMIISFSMYTFDQAAFAETEQGPTRSTFEFWAQCTNESNTDLNEDETCRVIKISNGNSMYVKHWVSGGSDEYTNYFRSVAINYTSGYIGGKWATVNMNVPITSNAYKIGKVHSIAGRGNSKHSLNDGNYRVSLHGWFYGDIN